MRVNLLNVKFARGRIDAADRAATFWFRCRLKRNLILFRGRKLNPSPDLRIALQRPQGRRALKPTRSVGQTCTSKCFGSCVSRRRDGWETQITGLTSA